MSTPRRSPRRPLAVVHEPSIVSASPSAANIAHASPSKSSLPNALSRTPQLLSRGVGVMCCNSVPRAKPKAPSTPGGSTGGLASDSGIDGEDDLSAIDDDDDELSLLPSDKAQAKPRISLAMPPPPPRYSEGGTAIGSYERFSIGGIFAGMATAASDDGSSADEASAAAAIKTRLPSATRLLLLEEQLRESERRAQELRKQNAILRQTLAPRASASAGTQTTAAPHPCFGELLADFGHKRVYRASARNLVNTVPIWTKQRQCNEGRVDEIVRAKARVPSLMGPISCFEFSGGEGGLAMPSLTCPQPRAIFDGQHRARAAMRLLRSDLFTIDDDSSSGSMEPGADAAADAPPMAAASTGTKAIVACGSGSGRAARRPAVHTLAAVAAAVDPAPALACTPAVVSGSERQLREGLHDDFPLLVEVYPVRTERDIKELYLEVNKAESVKEIDLPDAIAPERKAHIDEACERLRKVYPDMFKPSERCRPPHVHRDTLRDKLFHHAASADVTSAEALYARVLAVNGRMAARPPMQWPERLRKPLEKAIAHNFFLGLDDYAWLDWL